MMSAVTLGLMLATSVRAETVVDQPRTEWAAVPGVTYDTDRGVGLALFGLIAALDPAIEPYRYRLEAQAFATFMEVDGQQEVTFQEHYINLDIPGLMADRFRVITSLQYNRQSNAGYFGIGNNTKVDANSVERNYSYDHTYPAAVVDGMWTGFDWLDLFGGLHLSDHRIKQYPATRLADDLSDGSGGLYGLKPHRRAQVQAGIMHDTRDHETWASKGGFHEVSGRGGLGFGQDRFGYQGVNLTLRLFVPLVEKHLVLAGRWLADGLMGEAPVYLLSEYGGLFPAIGLGGADSIRGLPSRRYHGAIKTLANTELRSRFLDGNFLGQSGAVGVVGFVDTGRVWSVPLGDAGRDGTGLGLHAGFGAGARLYWGDTFVVRIDHGWSSDSSGLYITVAEMF